METWETEEQACLLTLMSLSWPSGSVLWVSSRVARVMHGTAGQNFERFLLPTLLPPARENDSRA